MGATILNFSVPPKKNTFTYKKHTATITFEPATKMWNWEVQHVRTLTFDGTAHTQKGAEIAAKQQIDQIEASMCA